MLGKMHIGMLAMWRYDDVSDLACSRFGMFRMWDCRDVACLGYGILEFLEVGMWNVWDVACSGCGMFKMWDVGDVGCLVCGMWDVGCFPGCGMLIYKMPSQNIGRLALHSTDDSEKKSPPIKKSKVTESNSSNWEKIQNHILQLHAANQIMTVLIFQNCWIP